MKEIITKSIKLYGTCIIANIMCFMLIITFNMLGANLLTEKIGYTVYGTVSEGETVELYTHYFSDGDDLKKQDYIDKGYTLNEVTVRSQMGKSSTIVWDAIAQTFMLIIMAIFVYNELWNLGYKDNNAVRIKMKKEDKLKGLKIGLLATAPSYLLVTVLLFARHTIGKNLSIVIFGFLNSYLYKTILFITGGGITFSQLQIWKILIFYPLISVVPVIALVAYLIGYKGILISEKIIYKKN